MGVREHISCLSSSQVFLGFYFQLSWVCLIHEHRFPVSQKCMRSLSHLFYGPLTSKISPPSLWLVLFLLQLEPQPWAGGPVGFPFIPTESAACCGFFFLFLKLCPLSLVAIAILAGPTLATLQLSLIKLEMGVCILDPA